jgi:hypothetical protein
MITLRVIAVQISLVSNCLQLKERAVKRTLLPSMEERDTSFPKNSRYSKYS